MENEREKEKEKWVKACMRGEIKAYQAASALGVSVRQVENLKAKLKEGKSLIHGNCGRSSARRLPDEVREKILEEYQNPLYKGINFAHFTDILNEKEYVASYSAVCNVLKTEGYISPKAKRKPKKVHKTRERRPCFGELLQGDASEFGWFKNLGIFGKYALHGFIDDKTGKITGLHFALHECLDGYNEVFRQTLLRYGVPESLYLDGLSIFFSNKKEELTIEEELLGIESRLTQFGRICDYFGVSLIHARSSQAKGRIERLWETLQSRLPIELARRGIRTIEAANKFLQNEFIDWFNERFGVNDDAKSIFVPLLDGIDLDEILCYKEQRTVLKGGVISLKNVQFSVVGFDKIGAKIDILISTRLGVVAQFENRFYELLPIRWQKKSTNSSNSVDMILRRFVEFYTLKNEHAIRLSA